jgi:hypothetical protein
MAGLPYIPDQLNTKVVNVTFPKCGTCQYAQQFDNKGSADCYGNPPTVIMIGATKDVLGRAAMQLETFVPRVHKDRAACALHKPREDFATLGRS